MLPNFIVSLFTSQGIVFSKKDFRFLK